MPSLVLCQQLPYTYLKNKAGIFMKPEDVKKHYRSLYNFSKETKMSHSTLANWLKWGFVPEASQYKLERITNGLLKTEWSDDK